MDGVLYYLYIHAGVLSASFLIAFIFFHKLKQHVPFNPANLKYAVTAHPFLK